LAIENLERGAAAPAALSVIPVNKEFLENFHLPVGVGEARGMKHFVRFGDDTGMMMIQFTASRFLGSAVLIGFALIIFGSSTTQAPTRRSRRSPLAR
jgi:hypothetical protein